MNENEDYYVNMADMTEAGRKIAAVMKGAMDGVKPPSAEEALAWHRMMEAVTEAGFELKLKDP